MLKNSMATVQSLQKLYSGYGYTRFKMNKFEEYDTYARIKDFLISDKVITFTDTNGKLLAMKPDVTVSIIKNSDETPKTVQKLYYNENVYRVSGGAHAFSEIMQAGLECIGKVALYDICEVIFLAVKSLQYIGENFVLDISHMGFVSGLITAAGFDGEEAEKVLNAVSEKNLPSLLDICKRKGLDESMTKKISGLVYVYGPIETVIKDLKYLCVNEETEKALDEISAICAALSANGVSKNVQFDFSVVNDMKYYNGIVFRGYIDGVPTGVLSGGQYDKLMKKMKRESKAIGFAVYLDLLEQLDKKKDVYDVDVLLLYDESVEIDAVLNKAQEFNSQGKTVLVQMQIPEKIRYKELVTLGKEEA